MTEYFIYYRLATPDAAIALADVQAWQRALGEASPGLQCRLLKRPPAEGPETWMEVYAGLPADEGAAATLLAALQSGPPGAVAWQIGERHVEAFVPCAS